MENEINTLFWLGTSIMITLALVVVAILIIYQKNIRAYHYMHLKEQLRVIIEAEHKERARIAKELHDGMCSELATIQNFVTVLELTQDTAKKESLLCDIKQGLLECYNQSLTLSYNLSPPLISDNPLEFIVRNYLERLGKVTSIVFDFTSNKSVFDLNQSVKLEAYRILQEIIQNIIKHSDALKVEIRLVWSEAKLVITVKDNGKSYEFNSNTLDLRKGIGLNNIRARVKQIKASLDFQTSIKGNVITIIVLKDDY